MIHEEKKGQVTLFVIIGLIILLAMSLVFFLTRVVSVDEPNYDPNDVSIETRPATLLVTSCLESSTIKGLQVLGSQGGMMYPRSPTYPSYKGSSVLFEPYAVPYWRYLDECGQPSGCELSQKPPLCSSDARYCAGLDKGSDSIQRALEDFIVEDVETCINDFASIADQYDIEKTGEEITAEVIFAEGKTHVVLNYPIILRSFSSDNTRTVQRFESDVDIDMISIYSLAKEILSFEKQTNYYERQTMNLLSAYTDVEGILPPTDYIEFLGAGGNIWILEEIREELTQNILPFMSLIRFANAANGQPMISNDLGNYTQYATGYYTSFLPKTSNTVYDNLEVTHQYIYDPVYVKVGDGSQVIKGTELIQIENEIIRGIIGIALKDYRFEYDISYPLIVSISDPTALSGEGFTFDFALEVNVRNNYPGYGNFTVIQSIETSPKGLGDFPLAQEHTFTTIDKHTREPLSLVEITYVCGNEYEVGYTSFSGDVSSLVAQLPPCDFGGYIRYKKNGYLGGAIEFNNVDTLPAQTFNLELWPIKKREIQIRKRTTADIDEIIESGTQGIFAMDTIFTPVTKNDSIIFTLDRETNTSYETPVPLLGFLRYQLEDATASSESDYVSLINDAFEQGLYSQEDRDDLLEALAEETSNDDEYADTSVPSGEYFMDFVPGEFTVDTTLMYLPGTHLAATVLDESTGLDDWFDGKDEVTLEAKTFPTWISGGGLYSFNLTEDDVYRDNPIIFYVYEGAIPHSWEELLNGGNVEEQAKLFDKYLQPILYPIN